MLYIEIYFLDFFCHTGLFAWVYTLKTVGISSWSCCGYFCWWWIVGCTIPSWGVLHFLVSHSSFIYLFVFWWYLILVVHIANNGNCRGGPFFRPKTNSGQCKFNHFPCNFPFYILLLWLILAIPGRLEWSWCTHQLQHQVHEKWWWNTCDKEGYWEAGSASQGAHCCLWRG